MGGGESLWNRAWRPHAVTLLRFRAPVIPVPHLGRPLLEKGPICRDPMYTSPRSYVQSAEIIRTIRPGRMSNSPRSYVQVAEIRCNKSPRSRVQVAEIICMHVEGDPKRDAHT